jgi:hypothetical protein
MARELHQTASEREASVRDALRAFLEARRDRICAELGEHPRPVAACDVHFNRLLEERTAVCRELDRLQALRGGIEYFVRSCPCLDEEARRRFLALLGRSTVETAARP